jgi:hypothetical protein
MSDDVQGASTSRRAFLTGAAGAAIGAGLLGAAGAASAAPASSTADTPPWMRSPHPKAHPHRPPHRHYQRGHFENTKGAKVVVTTHDGERVTLTISAIEPLGVAHGAKSGSHLWHNAFTVSMTGPKGTNLPQGTYPVSVNGKAFDLFVVPVVRTTDTPQFEAIINRAYYRKAAA